jgi:hypothetical protein
MTQFTCKGVKQINNRISFKHLYHSYLSAFYISAGVPNGEFPEILIAKCRSRFIWFIFLFEGGKGVCGRLMSPAHETQSMRETPAKRGRVNRYDITCLTNKVLHYYITCLWPTKYYIITLPVWPTKYYIITLPVSDQQCITLLHYLSLTNKVLHYLSDQQSIALLHYLSLTNNVLHYYITCLWPTMYYIITLPVSNQQCITLPVWPATYYITCLWPITYYIITLPVSDQQSITLLHYLSLTNKVLHYLSLTNNVLHYYITCLWPTKYYIITLPVSD